MSAGPSDGFDSAAARLIGVAVGKSGRPPRPDGCITSTQPISVIRGRFDHGAACVHSLQHRYVRNHSTNRSRALLDGGIWSKPDRAFQIRTIGAGLHNVAGLHRQEFSNGRTTDGLLNQPNEFNHLDRAAVADIIEPPRRTACRRIGRYRPTTKDSAQAGA